MTLHFIPMSLCTMLCHDKTSKINLAQQNTFTSYLFWDVVNSLQK